VPRRRRKRPPCNVRITTKRITVSLLALEIFLERVEPECLFALPCLLSLAEQHPGLRDEFGLTEADTGDAREAVLALIELFCGYHDPDGDRDLIGDTTISHARGTLVIHRDTSYEDVLTAELEKCGDDLEEEHAAHPLDGKRSIAALSELPLTIVTGLDAEN